MQDATRQPGLYVPGAQPTMLSPPSHTTPGGQAYPGWISASSEGNCCSAVAASKAASLVMFCAGNAEYDPKLQMKPSAHLFPPAPRGVAWNASRVQKCPRSHRPVGAVRPVVLQYRPCAQRVHATPLVPTSCGIVLYRPTAHRMSVCVLEPAGQTYPAAQAMGFTVRVGQ